MALELLEDEELELLEGAALELLEGAALELLDDEESVPMPKGSPPQAEIAAAKAATVKIL